MFAQIISTIDSFLWGWPLIILLFGTHIFMTIRTGFIQKDIFKAIKMSVTADEDSEGDVSQFGALTTALSSTIGTGNIIGVGTAIAMGGPVALGRRRVKKTCHRSSFGKIWRIGVMT